ncbi:MAG: endolytic transglycosylase MltG [Acidimicrobiia bacterium]|nr:MAG: endolytic transglycosylase MltG [Acidimicrobiia bacterium]
MSLELERYRPPPRPGRSRAIRALTAMAITAVSLLAAYAGVKWLAAEVSDLIAGPSVSTVAPGIPVEFEVEPGASASQIARDLAAAGVVESASAFDRVVREQRAADRLQAGVYQLETGMAPTAVLALLMEGPPRSFYLLTVVEGLTTAQMLESVSRQTDIPFEDLTRVLLDGTVTSSLMPGDATALQDWEGLLFPDTYEFAADATAADILDRMARTAEQRVASIDWSALEAAGYTPYEGLIIASVIEREAVLDDDRPLVAGVIMNRLEAGMKLQMDATVVYALGGLPPGGLTLADLEVDSPYNTYRISGLPPTPIAGVGPASLAAAASPAETDHLYFLVADDTGALRFTADFDEFIRWQQEGVGG